MNEAMANVIACYRRSFNVFCALPSFPLSKYLSTEKSMDFSSFIAAIMAF
jgi:hypothetical protein